MSDASQGPGWWQASDGKWYPPQSNPSYSPTAPLPTAPSAKPPRPWFKKKRFIIPVALVVLIVIGAAASGGSKNKKNDIAQSSTTTAASGTKATAATVAPPAKATKAKFTLAKYNQLQNGMSYEEVKTIAGGEPQSSSNSDIGGMKLDNYIWPGNGLGDTVSLTFEDGKLYSKTEFGLGQG